MPLTPPILDNRTFDDLVQLALTRIARYTPEWTDFNHSDPGRSLVELFAWLTEIMLYRINQVPERNYLKFLKLLNLELEPAKPATAHLTIVPVPTIAGGGYIPAIKKGMQFAGQAPETGDLVVFEVRRFEHHPDPVFQRPLAHPDFGKFPG